MTVNKRLLRKTLRFIQANPEKHDQTVWCGTAMCIAGWACHIEGYRASADADAIGVDDTWGNPLVANERTVGEVDEVAMSLLGLTPAQANDLFASHNTLGDLRRIVTGLCK